MITAQNVHKQLTVGEVAARSGVAVTALHFYESKGLIKSQRNACLLYTSDAADE